MLYLASLLDHIGQGGSTVQRFNPIHYASRVNASRRVRYLVGRDDHMAPIRHAEFCKRLFKDGKTHIVSNLGHTTTQPGYPTIDDHVARFLHDELADWSPEQAVVSGSAGAGVVGGASSLAGVF